jgi:ankyrin repeat protein
MAELLINAKPELTSDDLGKNKHGYTPLHSAAGTGNIEMVELLVDNAPQLILARNNENETPLDYAAARGHNKVVKFLSDSMTKVQEF